MRAQGRETGIDHAALALFDLIDRSLHVVVDAPPRNAAQGHEAPGMGIEQHLVALAGVGHQYKGSAGAQLGVCDQQFAPDATDDERFLAPVELESVSQFQLERHKGPRRNVGTGLLAPVPDEVAEHRVATGVALRLDLGVQCLARASVPFGAAGICFEGAQQNLMKRRQLPWRLLPTVFGCGSFDGLEPLLDGVTRKPGSPCYLRTGQLVPVEHPSDLA